MGNTTKSDTKTSTSSKRLAVYNIKPTEAGKPFFKSIGVAFINKDSSINVILDSLPLDGKLHIREAKVAGTKEGEGAEE